LLSINKKEWRSKMKSYRESLNAMLQDPEFKEEYERIQPEMDIIRTMVDARISQNSTQEELSNRDR